MISISVAYDVGDTCEVCPFKAAGDGKFGLPECALFGGSVFNGVDSAYKILPLKRVPGCAAAVLTSRSST